MSKKSPIGVKDRSEAKLALESWQRIVANELRLALSGAPEGPKTPEEFQGVIDRFCAGTDRVVAWCDKQDAMKIDATPLADFKETVLAYLRLPNDPSRPGAAELVRTCGKANGTANRLLSMLAGVEVSQGKQVKARVSVDEANQAMFAAVEADPDRMKWTAREWARHVGCSTSTVVETEMWQQARRARERAKQERMQSDRARAQPDRGRRRRHYSED